MVLLSSIASAANICVPARFQHWCDESEPTLAAALVNTAATPGSDEIHLRWDVSDTIEHPVMTCTPVLLSSATKSTMTATG